MKIQILMFSFIAVFLVSSVSAEEKSCLSELGKKSEMLVNWCTNVSPATRPPCHSSNSCELIIEEIKRGCTFLKNDKKVPYYCRLTYQSDSQ